MNHTIITLVIGFALIAALIGWLVVTSSANPKLKFLLIPAVMWYAWYLMLALPQLEGIAFNGWPKGTVTYLDHRIVGQTGAKRIEMWLQGANGQSKLYSVPFNAELAKELDAAKANVQNGFKTKGTFEKRGQGNKGMSGVDDHVFVAVRPNSQQLLPPKQDSSSSQP